jgi:hypothetical protein
MEQARQKQCNLQQIGTVVQQMRLSQMLSCWVWCSIQGSRQIENLQTCIALMINQLLLHHQGGQQCHVKRHGQLIAGMHLAQMLWHCTWCAFTAAKQTPSAHGAQALLVLPKSLVLMLSGNLLKQILGRVIQCVGQNQLQGILTGLERRK